MQVEIAQVLGTLSEASTTNYIEHAVLGLSRAAGADFVFVADVDLTTYEANTLALCEHGKIIPNFSYLLTGTPCVQVTHETICIYRNNVCKEFPDDQILKEMNVEGYLGMPLYDREKKVHGILVALYTHPIQDSEEVITLFSLFSNLISMELERLLADEKHRQSTEQYRDLYDNAPNGYLSIGMDDRIIRCNRRAEEMLGYSKKELIGSSVLMLYADTADGSERAKRVLERRKLRQVIRDQELQMKRADGSIIWVSFTIRMIKDFGGNQLESSSMIVDITERKQVVDKLRKSEESLNMAQEVASIGSWDWNIQNETLSWSKQTYSHFGFKPGEITPTYDGFKNFVHPDDRKHVENAVEKALKGDAPYSVETRVINADGVEWIMHAQGLVYRDDKGNPIRFIGTTQDITERKQMEEALRRAQKMDAVGQLTGGIAHDFNNILSIIMGNLSLLKDQVKDEGKLLERITTIDGATHRAAELVKQLLGFSRRQETDVIVSNLNRIIEGMDNLIKRSVTPEIEVDEQLAENLWVTGINQGDFQDALLNLILNARDAMPSGGRLTIETRNCTLNAAFCAQHPNLVAGEYVQLSLSDTGEGMTAAQLGKIYDPFYTTKPTGKGTGLGLSMVFGFITRSKGHIEVQSILDSGTTFLLHLPRATEEALPINNIDQQPKAVLEGSETILAVDDEEALLELTRESLEALGYRVLTAINGKEALERLAEHPTISLLFSDIIMPGGMTGFELAEQAVKLRSDLKVLLTSGHTEKTGDHLRGKHNLLMKPYSQEALAHQIRSLLSETETSTS